MSEILEDYLPRAEAAKQINRTERTLQRWANQRVGPPVTRIGNQVLYRKDALRDWLKSLETPMVRGRRGA
ncbi:MAG: helix-turn-helix domain-containing protein [Xanthobacteraceae bacterium]|nr:helix-turn-helix domain-containing protein [Xanthobacteraceae bacterium]MBX3547736.1 helix-turn-helix domain-containing protein [Xanthobacteraceae bacterium]